MPRVIIAHNGSKYTEPKAPGVAMSWEIASTATRDLMPILATILSETTPPTTTPMDPVSIKKFSTYVIDAIKSWLNNFVLFQITDSNGDSEQPPS